MKKSDSIKVVLRGAIFHELKVPKEDISIDIQGSVADISTGQEKFSVWLESRKMKRADIICLSSHRQEEIKAARCKYILLHSERGKVGYWGELGKELNYCMWERHASDEFGEDVLIYELIYPYTA